MEFSEVLPSDIVQIAVSRTDGVEILTIVNGIFRRPDDKKGVFSITTYQGEIRLADVDVKRVFMETGINAKRDSGERFSLVMVLKPGVILKLIPSPISIIRKGDKT